MPLRVLLLLPEQPSTSSKATKGDRASSSFLSPSRPSSTISNSTTPRARNSFAASTRSSIALLFPDRERKGSLQSETDGISIPHNEFPHKTPRSSIFSSEPEATMPRNRNVPTVLLSPSATSTPSLLLTTSGTEYCGSPSPPSTPPLLAHPSIPIPVPKDDRGRPILKLTTAFPKVGKWISYRDQEGNMIIEDGEALKAPIRLKPPVRFSGGDLFDDHVHKDEFWTGKTVELGWWKRSSMDMQDILSRAEAKRLSSNKPQPVDEEEPPQPEFEIMKEIPIVPMTEITANHFGCRAPVVCLVSGGSRNWQYPLPHATAEQRDALHRLGVLVVALPPGHKRDSTPVTLATVASVTRQPIQPLSVKPKNLTIPVPSLGVIPSTPTPTALAHSPASTSSLTPTQASQTRMERERRSSFTSIASGQDVGGVKDGEIVSISTAELMMGETSLAIKEGFSNFLARAQKARENFTTQSTSASTTTVAPAATTEKQPSVSPSPVSTESQSTTPVVTVTTEGEEKKSRWLTWGKWGKS